MAFNKSIQNFIGGITEQPFTQRQDNEVTEETNCFNSVNKGLIRRPGTYHVADLQNSPTDIVKINTIKYRDGFMLVGNDKNIYY